MHWYLLSHWFSLLLGVRRSLDHFEIDDINLIMADRKLRSGTKKDYKKMADVDNISDEDSGAENRQEDGEPSKNENKHSGADSDESQNGSNNNGSSSSEGCSEDDEDIKRAQERLKSLKRQQKKLKKERKLQYLAREAEEIEKQLKQAKSKGNKKKKRADENVVTVASLRGMSDVVDEVDQLMDKKFNLKTGNSSSSSSSDDSTDGTGSDSGAEKLRKKGKRETSETKKHRSGKSKKLTSYVPFPQKWPHSHLTLHFVSREKKFEELTIAEFCAGYIAILEMSQGSVKVHRTSHFKELMYLATKYQWRHVLNYHAACLMEIERGHLKWGDSFQLLQSTTLAGGILPSQQSASNSGSRSWGSSEGVGKEGGTVFCRFYQRGTCSQVGDHQGFFQGEKRLLKHICAECWLKSRKLEVHPQNSDVCPLK